MANKEELVSIDTTKLLSILNNEEELIVKPFNSAHDHAIGVIECGKIVSRLNKTLLDYRIGDITTLSKINSLFHRRIMLLNPQNKEVIVDFYHNRLPLLFKACHKQNIRCLVSQSNQTQLIGSIRKRLVLGKLWYDVYDNNREQIASLTLHSHHLKDKIQHRSPEFSILDVDEMKEIGHIFPFSTDLEGSEYGNAIAMKIPQNMPVEKKAILLIGTLMLKSRIDQTT